MATERDTSTIFVGGAVHLFTLVLECFGAHEVLGGGYRFYGWIHVYRILIHVIGGKTTSATPLNPRLFRIYAPGDVKITLLQPATWRRA